MAASAIAFASRDSPARDSGEFDTSAISAAHAQDIEWTDRPREQEQEQEQAMCVTAGLV